MKELKWVSVKDRLPDKFTPVLVAVCPKLSMSQVNIAVLDNKSIFEVLDEKGNHADFITHWKDLPELPKEDECKS
jgi:hypothetical protein